MFNSKKKSYTVKTKTTTTNDYGEVVETYSPAANNVLMFISLSNEITQNNADMRVQQASHIGITKDSLSLGDIVDDKYEVLFVNEAGRENVVFLMERENDGSFDNC